MPTVNRKRVDRGIYKVSDNVYELVVSLGPDPSRPGRYKQKWQRHHGTLTSARDARRKLLAQVEEGDLSPASGTVNELFDLWLLDLERLGRAPKTLKGYRDDARMYWRPAIGAKPVAKVELRDLRAVLDGLMDRGLSRETIRHVRACISGAFTWAMTEGWITRDPSKVLKIPMAAGSRPLVPTPDEVKRLLAAAKVSHRPEMERVIWLGAITGARSSEIRALRRSDFDLAAGIMGVERALSAEKVWTTKNRQIRDVALDQATVNVVLAQITFMETRGSVPPCPEDGTRMRAQEDGTRMRAQDDGWWICPQCHDLWEKGDPHLDVERVPLPLDGHLFSDHLAGAKPWREEIITKFFSGLADDTEGVRDELTFKHLRKFMSTYGRELGFTGEAVADRAGHDPAVAEKHYRGRVESARDLELSSGLAGLLSPATE